MHIYTMYLSCHILTHYLTVFTIDVNTFGMILSTKKHQHQFKGTINSTSFTVLHNKPIIEQKVFNYPRNKDFLGMSSSGIVHHTMKRGIEVHMC